MKFSELIGKRVGVTILSYESGNNQLVYGKYSGKLLAIDGNMIAVKVDSEKFYDHKARKFEPPQMLWFNTLSASLTGLAVETEEGEQNGSKK